MTVYTVWLTKINDTEVEASSKEEALELASNIDLSDFDWSENNTLTEIEVESETEEQPLDHVLNANILNWGINNLKLFERAESYGEIKDILEVSLEDIQSLLDYEQGNEVSECLLRLILSYVNDVIDLDTISKTLLKEKGYQKK